MKTELRECPFCAGTDLLATDSFQGNPMQYHVYCKSCGTNWVCINKNWNHRPIEDGLQAEIDRLKAKVAELESYKQLRNDIYANDASVLMGAPLTIEVVDRNTDRHFRFSSDWGLIKDDGGWEATRQLILDRFENWREG